MDWNEVKDLPMGHVWRHDDLAQHFQTIRGGVAFPGKNPGYAVVVGLHGTSAYRICGRDVYVLGEFESADLGELLRQCSVLSSMYSLSHGYQEERFLWIGDDQNRAARALRDELAIGPSLYQTPILDMPQPYTYMLPMLKGLLREDRRILFLKDSKVRNHMSAVRAEDLSELEFGAFPAIEALAIVVAGLRNGAPKWYEPYDDQDEPYDPNDFV